MSAKKKTKLVKHPSYIDETVLEEFKKFMGDEGESLVKELIELYLTNAPQLINLIKNDISSGDIESLKTHIHSLKGNSGQLGVSGIAELCRQIEDVINEGKFVEIDPLFEKLEKTYQQVEIALKNK